MKKNHFELKNYVNKNNLNVEFLGRVSQKELVEYYISSEIFVSLNPSEPFGIVFPEALLSQCKIVCPYTGGQVEYLSDYSNSVAFVDETDEKSIALGIEKLLSRGEIPKLTNEQMKSYTYEEISKNILKYIK